MPDGYQGVIRPRLTRSHVASSSRPPYAVLGDTLGAAGTPEVAPAVAAELLVLLFFVETRMASEGMRCW